jgi:predicted transcriptional regulator
MVRTQIQLDDKVAKRLPLIAASRKMSVAAFIREAVDARIAELDRQREAAWARALAVVEKGFPDVERATDVAENHDRYYADDIYERKILGNRRSRRP